MFADDILIFARTAHKTIFPLESLMKDFAEVFFSLNGDKTVVLTNEAQPPSHLWTHTGIKLQVKNWSGVHKYLGCILCVGKAGRSCLACLLACLFHCFIVCFLRCCIVCLRIRSPKSLSSFVCLHA